MPAFKMLDPEVIRKAIEGQEDVISPLVKKEEAFFRNIPCRVCKSEATETILNTANPFTAGVPLPNKLIRCLQCRTEFDPYTGLIHRTTAESD